METRIATVMTALLFTLLLVSMVSAATEPTVNVTPLLNSAQTDMQCRVAFDTGFMGAMIETFSPMEDLLGPRIEDLKSDESQLNQYANRGDVMNYSMYLHENYSKHLKQDIDAVEAAFEDLKNQTPPEGEGGSPDEGGPGNETGGPSDDMKEDMEALQTEYQSLMEDLGGCFDTEKHANLVLDYYNTTLNLYEFKAQNLTGRGINASNLLELVGGARTQIMAPLKNGTDSATNSSQLRMLLNQYCLYDGCANGTNFHMAVRFEAVRMAYLLEAMSPEANDAGLGSNVTAANASLSAAIDEINSWGTDDPSPDKLKEVWTNINSAAKGSHDIFIALNSSTE